MKHMAEVERQRSERVIDRNKWMTLVRSEMECQ